MPAEHQRDGRVGDDAWDRTYLLLVRTPASIPTVDPTRSERDALASDVVAGEARGAIEPFWWRTDDACRLPAPQMLPVGRRLGYDRDDPVARGLAERIVALALGAAPAWVPVALRGGGDPLRAVPMTAGELRRGLAAGTIMAAISAVPALTPVGCDDALLRVEGLLEIPLVEIRLAPPVRGRVPPLLPRSGAR